MKQNPFEPFYVCNWIEPIFGIPTNGLINNQKQKKDESGDK